MLEILEKEERRNEQMWRKTWKLWTWRRMGVEEGREEMEMALREGKTKRYWGRKRRKHPNRVEKRTEMTFWRVRKVNWGL